MRPFRLLGAVLVALAVSTPAAAQFGKIKDALNKKAEPKPATPAPQAPGQATSAGAPADGGLVVLTPEVVDRLLAGGKAAKAEREKAAQEDTPYGRYVRAKAAYEVAQPKCGAAQATWGQRAAADEKLLNRYSAQIDKAMALQQKGDMAGYEAGMYEALGMIDPSCAVRDPKQPDGFYDAQRAAEERANQAKLRSTGFTDREYGLASDRVIAILTGAEVPGGAAPSEKSAVSAKDPELKALYGLRDAQAERVAKQAPAPDPTPAPAPVQAQVPAAAATVNQCMVNNVQTHEAKIKALGDRGAAAQQAGNTQLMMAIADSIMRIQMAGCNQ
jgi:hypothetical protein